MRKSLIGLLIPVLLAACGAQATPAPQAGTAAAYLAPTASPTPTVLPGLTQVLVPTPTPIIYTIVQGDTLSGIAHKFGVTLDTLSAANPGVQPTALIVGQKLTIPTGNQAPGQPSPTPAPLTVTQARCWPEAAGGLWCFALLHNDFAETVEDVSIQFTLLDAGGQALASQISDGLLDILPSGSSLAIQVHFPAPAPESASLRAQVLTSIRLLPGDARYLPVTLENTLVSLDAFGRTAQVSGQAVLTGTGPAGTLWILATAYDAAGEVVGLRRWSASEPVVSATPVQFAFDVYSLGPAIQRVEFLTEARP